ncbi:HNH endonuclease [Bacteroides sp. UBA939]|uniref:HNH endonuclease n=1 Tax=Bacteroides sp. UBA939 TaxID=1946092 RepID=UPI0025C0C39A|nr:HNH endonuclease signature motif containing protein [Bacteroides sp. UBA939]
MSEYIQDLNNPQAIQEIWEKGIIVEGYNEDLYRQDFAGAWISRDAYGDTDSMFGWEIDHVYPTVRGGKNHIENLRPMNWRNNRSKGDDYPQYIAEITSENNKNIKTRTTCTVNSQLQATLKAIYSK